jgi:CheY-like chemotaxis protein
MTLEPFVSCSEGSRVLEQKSPLMRVLIAEDDPALASFVRKGLEAEHYAVDVTTDGEQARAGLQK